LLGYLLQYLLWLVRYQTMEAELMLPEQAMLVHNPQQFLVLMGPLVLLVQVLPELQVQVLLLDLCNC
jgi:hypothetical protein